MVMKPTPCILVLQMQTKTTPDRVLAETIAAIDELNLSDYAVGHLWAETSGATAHTLMRRLGRWRQNGVPESIAHWVELMNAIGCDVVVIKRK